MAALGIASTVSLGENFFSPIIIPQGKYPFTQEAHSLIPDL